MSLKFEDQTDQNSNYRKTNLSIIQSKNKLNQNNSIDFISPNNNLSTININNNYSTPLRKFTISKLLLNNSNSTNYKDRLNHYLQIMQNSPINNKKLNLKKITIFDRPIYDSIHPENEKNDTTEHFLFNFRSGKKKKPNKFFFNLKSKNKRNLEYFPKLLDLRKSCMINQINDKYKDKNILFIKLKDLNFENEIKNTTKKNFITPDKYLTISANKEAKFLEKKTTFKILENIKFRFRSPLDKSKLLPYTKNFNSFFTVNKFF